MVLKKYGGLGLGLETQSLGLGLGLGLDKKVLFTSLIDAYVCGVIAFSYLLGHDSKQQMCIISINRTHLLLHTSIAKQ